MNRNAGYKPSAEELASVHSVIDAVCLELGVKERERARRRAVEDRVLGALRRGRSLPLNLVTAGLAESDLRV